MSDKTQAELMAEERTKEVERLTKVAEGDFLDLLSHENRAALAALRVADVMAFEKLMRAWGTAGQDVKLLRKELDKKAKAAPVVQEQAEGVMVDPDDPDANALLFLKHHSPNVRVYQDQWADWDGAGYVDIEDKTIKQKIARWLRTTVTMSGTRTRVNDSMVMGLLSMLETWAHVPMGEADPPAWLNEQPGDPPASEIIALRNGLLHVPTRKFMEPNARYFTKTALTFDYVPDAPPPTSWLEFLDRVYEGNKAMIDVLQEAVGLMLIRDTSKHVIILRLGPSGGGKGTEIRIIVKLLGPRNCTSKSLRQLGSQFGLQSAIDKILITLPDVYQTKQTNSGEVTQQMLRISGEDSMTIERKNRVDWSGQMAARLWIAGTEEPILPDMSGSLLRRYVPILSYANFRGVEDTEIEAKLERELPGILLWAIEGYRRLNARPTKKFDLPPDSQAVLDKIRVLTNPVTAWMDAGHAVVDANSRERKADVFEAWREWAVEINEGLMSTTEDTFGRWLIQATGRRVTTTRPRTGQGGKQEPWYAGIRLVR